jgi:hypothetical protein
VHTPSSPFYTRHPDDNEHPLLTVLAAALRAAENHVRAAATDLAPSHDPNEAPVRVVLFAATLVADRCAELRPLLDFYVDAANDLDLHEPADDPF